MKPCIVQGCKEQLTNSGHQLCYKHWKMEKDGKLRKVADGTLQEIPTLSKSSTAAPEVKLGEEVHENSMISSTKIGSQFNTSPTKTNLILAELGWIERYTKGWLPTDQGQKMGAEVREMRQTGIPYVVWPASILKNPILLATVKDTLGGIEPESQVKTTEKDQTKAVVSEDHDDFREKFPATFRATDGHMVRSRAEMLIDNWLYMQGKVHAFERKLPVEEIAYCDFYLPDKKVYIEYWGMEGDPKYAARMVVKKAIYQKYNLNLVELNDDDIGNLDDILPRRLLKFGIDCT